MQTINFNKKRIDEIISKNWGKLEQRKIVDILNKEGLQTTTGKPWVQSLVSRYGRVNLNLSKNFSKIKDSSFNKKAVDAFILENIDLKLHLLANKLNEKGLYNTFGFPWFDSTVSKYILEVFPEYRRKNKAKRTSNIQPKQEPVKTQEVKVQENQEKNIVEINDSNLILKKVEFNGVELIGVQISDGRIFSPVKKICDDLGLEHSSQLQRIKRDDFIIDGLFTLNLPSNGGIQRTSCLDIEYLPNFLTGINTILCKPEIQPVLKEFKKKAKEVLAAAFIKKELVQQPQQLITDPLTILSMSINELKKTNDRVNQVEKEFSEFKVNVKQAIQSEIKEANKELEANLEKINKFNDRKVRLADNRLKQIALDLQIEKLPNYYDKTKKIVIDYTVVNGLKEEDAGINYDKLYSAMERKFQIPFRQNLEVINQQLPKNKQISKIKYFQQKGLEKQLFDTACELFVEK